MTRKKRLGQRYYRRRKRKTTNIYCITAGRFFYIGKANNPWKRLKIHKERALKNTGKNKRKNQMLKANFHKIRMNILEKPKMKDWRTRERHWIKHYRQKYGRERVLNISDGGDGASGRGYNDNRSGTPLATTVSALVLCLIGCYLLYLFYLLG